MQADKKIESFVVDRQEETLYYGTLSGQLVAASVDNFSMRREYQAHAGTIIAMALHPRLPYLACLGMDRAVSIWSISGLLISPVAFACVRNLTAENDSVHYFDITSNSQAIAFHPELKRLATRTANGAIAELDFDEDGAVTVCRSTRFHGRHDVITLAYTVERPYQLLSGSGSGEVVLSMDGEVIRRWKIMEESVHWFEHLEGSVYLVASDARLVSRLDVNDTEPLRLGPQFARDDFEHVVVNRTTKRAFASSFDRNVYEINSTSCLALGVVFQAPFKCRWLYSLARTPSRLLIQVRDGSLLDVNIDQKSILQELRTTPLALWTSFAKKNGSITVLGEGQRVLTIVLNQQDYTSLPKALVATSDFSWLPPTGYVKRADYCPDSDTVVAGHSNGHIYRERAGEIQSLKLDGAVRDLAIGGCGDVVYAVTESGSAWAISLAGMEVLGQYSSRNGFPLWALAVSPDQSSVAVFERHGAIHFLAGKELQPLFVIEEGGRCKRAKWLNNEKILCSYGGTLRIVDPATKSSQPHIEYAGNTVEDFIWDRSGRYLLTISYLNKIGLYDLASGEKLDEVYDQIDYSKGLAWQSSRGEDVGYPLDFITYGRSGTAHRFRIHNECIVGLGPVG